MTGPVLFCYICVCLQCLMRLDSIPNIVNVIHEYLGSPPGFGEISVAHPFCALCFVCRRPVCCVPIVTSISELCLLDCRFGFL